MRPANHLQIAAELRACGTDVLLGRHAHQRVLERTAIHPSHMQELIMNKRAVLLPWRDGNRSYHLVYDVQNEEFAVGVVAIDRGRGDTPSATVVTVLTREQFENDVGKAIEVRARRTAASRVLDPVAFRKWEASEFGEGVVRPKYRVFTYFKKPDGTIDHVVFSKAPVCRGFVEEHSLEHAASHPGFWEWYSRLAASHQIDIENVVAMRIAELDKVTLKIDAPPLQCPCCAAKTNAVH